jgi:uncharacterized protein
MAKQIYINLPVKDIKKSIEFFTELGFKFNPQFSDDKSNCLIIGENIFAMLMEKDRFKGFIPNREIADTEKDTEVLLAIDVENKEKVDEMINKVVELGGREFREAQDYGWMYLRAFLDLDGHIWEIGFMDVDKMPEEMKKKGD